jgi:hypothetical protein
MRSQRTSSSAPSGAARMQAATISLRLVRSPACGELEEQVEPGVDRDRQAEPDRALRAGGQRCLRRDLSTLLSHRRKQERLTHFHHMCFTRMVFVGHFAEHVPVCCATQLRSQQTPILSQI